MRDGLLDIRILEHEEEQEEQAFQCWEHVLQDGG